MTEQNFINSNFRKFEKLFFEKRLQFAITLSDEDDDLIDNVLYLKLENDEFRGVFINGSNPIFSESYIQEVDIFNLYENYEIIKTKSETELDFKIDSIRLFFNAEYNELGGFYLSDKAKEKSFSIIFMGDELQFQENVSLVEFNDKLSNSQLHITNRLIYSIDAQNKDWVKD